MSTSEPSIYYWRDLAQMYRMGIDSYAMRVSEPDFTLPARVGLWTDLCIFMVYYAMQSNVVLEEEERLPSVRQAYEQGRIEERDWWIEKLTETVEGMKARYPAFYHDVLQDELVKPLLSARRR